MINNESTRKVLQQTLGILESVLGNINPERGFVDELEADITESISVLRTALTKPDSGAASATNDEAQPVAWIEHHKGGDNLNWERVDHPYATATPLYAAPQPPAEQGVELSDEQLEAVIDAADRAFRLCGGVQGQQLTAADSRDHHLMRAAIAADRKARGNKS